METATQHNLETSKKGALRPLQDLGIFFLPDHILSSLESEPPTTTTISATRISLESTQTISQFDNTLTNTQLEQTRTDLTPVNQRPALTGPSPSCRTCGLIQLPSVEAQRKHIKSDWHQYNLKQRLLDERAQPVSQEQFERILQGLLSSVLHGESDAGDHKDPVQTLFKKLEAAVHENDLSEEADPLRRQQRRMFDQQLKETRMSPMIWFTSKLYGPTVRLGVYKNALADRGQGHNPLELLKSIQIPVPRSPPKKKKVRRAARVALLAQAEQKGHVSLDTQNASLTAIDQEAEGAPVSADLTGDSDLLQCQVEAQPRYWTLILLGGGHFAAMVVDLRGETNKAARQGSHSRTIKVVAHKTFHRYTVRRKQGGTQSSHGGCNSAGAMVRMYNERALKLEVRELLEGWSQWIEQSEFVFMHAPGNNRRILFHENSVISLADREGRVRSIPFVTRRPTLTELKRVYQDLVTVQVKVVLETSAKTACADMEPRQVDPLNETLVSLEPVSQEQARPSTIPETIQGLQKLVDMVKKGRVEAMSNYLARTGLNPSHLLPKSSHAEYNRAKTPTLLHLASLHGQARIVQQLLEVHGADPTATLSVLLEHSSQNPTSDDLRDVVSPVKSRTAYDLAMNKETRNAFRSAMAKMPEAWDWVKLAHVPSALVAQAEDEQGRLDTPCEGMRECGQGHRDPRVQGRRIGQAGTSSRVNDKSPVVKTSRPRSRGPQPSVISDRERIAQAAEARLAASRQGDTMENDERVVMTDLLVAKPLSKRSSGNHMPLTGRGAIVPNVQKTTRGQSSADRRANSGK